MHVLSCGDGGRAAFGEDRPESKSFTMPRTKLRRSRKRRFAGSPWDPRRPMKKRARARPRSLRRVGPVPYRRSPAGCVGQGNPTQRRATAPRFAAIAHGLPVTARQARLRCQKSGIIFGAPPGRRRRDRKRRSPAKVSRPPWASARPHYRVLPESSTASLRLRGETFVELRECCEAESCRITREDRAGLRRRRSGDFQGRYHGRPLGRAKSAR
jgi:hypothetical protein